MRLSFVFVAVLLISSLFLLLHIIYSEADITHMIYPTIKTIIYPKLDIIHIMHLKKHIIYFIFPIVDPKVNIIHICP